MREALGTFDQSQNADSLRNLNKSMIEPRGHWMTEETRQGFLKVDKRKTVWVRNSGSIAIKSTGSEVHV